MTEDYNLETLANGVTIAWKHVPDVPDIATALIFTVGTSNAPLGLEQAPHFVEHLFFKPTPKHSANIPVLIREITGRPISRNSAKTFPHCVVVKNRLPAKNQEIFLGLLYDTAESTQLDSSEVEKERIVIKEEIEHLTRDVGLIYQQALSATLPGFYKPVTVEAVERLTLSDLATFKQRAINSQNAILVLVGNVTDESIRIASGYFGRLRSGEKLEPPSPPSAQERMLFSYSGKGIPVHSFTKLWQGPPLADSDYHLLETLLEYLGGSLDSRLGRRLRDESSLVYGIAKAFLEFGPVSVAELGISSFKPQNFGTIVAIVEEEIEMVRSGRFDERLLSSLRESPTLTFFERHYETLEARRGSITDQVTLGRKPDTELLKLVTSFTAADLAAVARKYFGPNSTGILLAPGGQLPARINATPLPGQYP